MGFSPILENTVLVLQDESNLDDTSKTSSHQRVAEDLVGHGTDH